jgi:hypothetical protein
VWTAGVVFAGGRLILGWLWLTRLRRTAQSAPPASWELLNECRDELNTNRSARLLTHPLVYSPILIGGIRPCVVVPPGWEQLPADVRRAGLLHELAHLARRDDWAKLGEELVRAVFFFHPLVRWLLNRLDGERERLCDAAVVRHGMDPRRFASVLLDFAKRLGARQPALRRGTVLPFFNRVTVKDRIHQLLEHDMNRWIAPLSRPQMAALAAGVLLLLLGLGSLGVRSAEPFDPPTPPAQVQEEKREGGPAPAKGVALDGKLVDRSGKPVVGAKIGYPIRGPGGAPNPGIKLETDKQARFRLEGMGPGSLVGLEVETPDGQSFEVNVVVAEGVMEVELPTVLGAGVKGPEDVEVGELAGVVVDNTGQPIEGVDVHVWDWSPENQTTTGKDGIFRLKDLGRDSRVQVRFQKSGYSPEMFVWQPTGKKGWVVALDNKTYFEGIVLGPEGKPAAGASIRADQGPKFAQGVGITHIWTETEADASGHYLLYVQPDQYEFQAKAAGVGVARLPKKAIGHGQASVRNIQLEQGVIFRATTVDSVSGQPVKGVRLWNWEHKDVEGHSDDKGEVTITELLPGKFEFDIEADGYTRWWSEEAASPWARHTIDNPKLGWQRNFDNIDYDLSLGMKPVTIVLEKGVRIKGRVVDPDGKPVGGATVAPALTGTGNSLTGDTRFSVETKEDGTFEMLLPASNKAVYNLVAHDGKYQEWRHWANGVLDPINTTPGQEINDVTLKLTRPATIRGKVVDAAGKPVAFREVRAHSADKRENRYYDPTTTTKEDGTFELRLIRPGEQFIQAAPFWLTAEEAPKDSTKKLKLAEGEIVEKMELVGAPENR